MVGAGPPFEQSTGVSRGVGKREEAKESCFYTEGCSEKSQQKEANRTLVNPSFCKWDRMLLGKSPGLKVKQTSETQRSWETPTSTNNLKKQKRINFKARSECKTNERHVSCFSCQTAVMLLHVSRFLVLVLSLYIRDI